MTSTHRSRSCFAIASLLALVFIMAGTAPVSAQEGRQAPEAYELLNRKVIALYKKGRYEQAKPIAVRTLKLAEETLGSTHPRLVQVMNNLAELNRKLGHHADAEHLYLRALNIGVKAYGKNHPMVAILLSNLAMLYEALGKLDQAEVRYRHAFNIYKSELGSGHRRTLRVASMLGALHKKMEAEGRSASRSTPSERSLSAIVSKLP